MSQFTTPNGAGHDAPATMKNAAHEASGVTGTARDAAHDVAETGAHEAAAVAGEARDQLRDLVSQTGHQLSEQASTQKQRVAAGLGSAGDDLSRMADADGGSGPAGEMVRRAAGHVSTAASWLENREPAQLLDDVKGFARRRPGTFIAVAALAGIVVGRLSRSLAAGSPATHDSTPVVPDAAGGRLEDRDLSSGVDDRGIAAGLDDSDPPVYAQSAARIDGTREDSAHDRPGTV